MSQNRVTNYSNSSQPFTVMDTANTANAAVVRDTDNSVNVGQANCAGVNNTGPTYNSPANYTTTATLGTSATDVTVDGAGGVFTVTLPAASAATGQEYRIARKYTANAVTIKGSGSEIIVSNGASANTFVLSAQGQQVFLFCDGTQWYATGSRGSLETLIPDPGNAGAIPVVGSGYCPIVTAGSETRTLAAPSFIGQELLLYIKTDGGTCVITVASAINQAANTIITMADVRDVIRLVAIESGSSKVWHVVSNDGAALS